MNQSTTVFVTCFLILWKIRKPEGTTQLDGFLFSSLIPTRLISNQGILGRQPTRPGSHSTNCLVRSKPSITVLYQQFGSTSLWCHRPLLVLLFSISPRLPLFCLSLRLSPKLFLFSHQNTTIKITASIIVSLRWWRCTSFEASSRGSAESFLRWTLFIPHCKVILISTIKST